MTDQLKEALFNFENGMSLYEQGHLDEAYLLFARALELNEEYAGAHFFLGSIHHDWGQFEQSLFCWEKARDLDPHDQELKLLITNLRQFIA